MKFLSIKRIFAVPFHYSLPLTNTHMNSLFLFVALLLVSSCVAQTTSKTFVGGVFFPTRYNPAPQFGLAWFDTCDTMRNSTTVANYPLQISFSYTAPTDNNAIHNSTIIDSITIVLDDGFAENDGASNGFSTDDWEFVEGNVQLLNNVFAGFNFVAVNTIANVEFSVDNFTWQLQELVPFSSPFATGFFFNCNDPKTNTSADSGCPLDPCSVDCNIGGINDAQC